MDWDLFDIVTGEETVGKTITSAYGSRMFLGSPELNGSGVILKSNRYQLLNKYPVSTGDVRDVERSQEQWTLVGENGLVKISDNGIHWASVQTDIEVSLTRVVRRNGLWLAVGGNAEIWISHDRENWRKVYEHKGFTLRNVDYANGQWVCVGHAQDSLSQKSIILSTKDLEEWSEFQADSYQLHSLAWGNGFWIGVKL
jgi:hypothetical protein